MILEYVNLREFGWVNYGFNENQIEATIQKILNYKLKQESKIICEGADICKTVEHEAWKKRCQTLLQTYFPKAGQFSGVITFPDTSFACI